jgi:GTP-binding protein EngB required for normal cell division
MLPRSRRPVRLILFAVFALLAAALLWIAIGALRGAIGLWHDLQALPSWAQYGVIALVALLVMALAWLGVMLLRPRRRRTLPVAAPTRAEVEQRLDALSQREADTAELRAELEELERRARSEAFYVAVFGEISAGKSSVIRALAPGALPQTDVIGGTTRAVAHYTTPVAGRTVTFADVPGSHEVGGAQREQVARDEALRAHAVVYVCAGDLTRDQDAELRWLRGFGKPLILALNKVDRYDAAERAALERVLAARYADVTDARVVIAAGGSETFERRLPDGRHEQVRRERVADVAALRALLERHVAAGSEAFEPAREAAVLTAVAARADSLRADVREREAAAAVNWYTRRAVVGALAAVMPGSDLVIQGVLAAGLVRELCALYEVPGRDLDIEAFLGEVRLTVRTSASLVLAIAGNAAKAFPGLGTLGGGVLHAIAYGLIFDSLGRAVAATLREHAALDAASANATLARLLADGGGERVRRIIDLVGSAARDPE